MFPSGVLLCFAISLALASSQSRRLTINGVEYGSQEQTTRNSKVIHAFYGIPYARQPVGRFRFTRPEPLSKINEWRLTEEERRRYYTTPQTSPKSCPQIDPFTNTFDVSHSVEDCLRIDLYVLDEVFLHSTASKLYGVSVLVEGLDFKAGIARHINATVGGFADQTEVTVGVLAVVHYRLGAYGFLTTEDDEAPANLGLWDQREALNYIYELVLSNQLPNTDRYKLSLLGFGSGAISSSIFLANPQEIVKTALISGGGVLGPDANIRHARERGYEFARRFGCTSSNTHKMISCLRSIDDVEKIVTVAAEPQFLFGPVVDTNHTKNASKAYFKFDQEKLLTHAKYENLELAWYGFPELSGSYRYYSQKGARNAKNEGETVDERIKFYLRPFQTHDATLTALVASLKLLYFRNYTDEVVMKNETLFDELMINVLTDYLSVAPVLTQAFDHAGKRQKRNTVYNYYRAAEQQTPTLSSRLWVMKNAPIRQATSLDDLPMFVGIAGVGGGGSDPENRLSRFGASVFSEVFGAPNRRATQVGGVAAFNYGDDRPLYITAVRGQGLTEPLTTRYREMNRWFWSKYVPTFAAIVDDVSQKSLDRHDQASTYKKATLATSIVLGFLAIMCVILGVLLWKSSKSGSTNMASVRFEKVSTNDPSHNSVKLTSAR